MNGRVTILGCGNSAGVPAIGNEWGKCDPAEPKNRRRRPSIHIEIGEKGLLIDSGPDLKDQINSFNIKKLDCVLYTHDHSDHTLGIDDLRLYVTRQNKTIKAYGNQETLEELTKRFPFILKEQTYHLYPLVLLPHVLDAALYGTEVDLGGIPTRIFEQDHGRCTSLGIRVGDFAYSTDFIRLDEPAIQALKGIKTWVADAAAYHRTENKIHPTIEAVIELNKKIGAQQVYLTHMPITMDYQTLINELPPGYAPAYDGLQIEISAP